MGEQPRPSATPDPCEIHAFETMRSQVLCDLDHLRRKFQVVTPDEAVAPSYYARVNLSSLVATIGRFLRRGQLMGLDRFDEPADPRGRA